MKTVFPSAGFIPTCSTTSRTAAAMWTEISGLDEHGEYDAVIPPEETAQTAVAVIAYETAYLEQEIAFHEALTAKFFPGEHPVRAARS